MRLLAKVQGLFGNRWAPPPPPVPDPLALEVELAETRARREDTFRRAPDIHSLTAKLHAEERRNHFGEAVTNAMQRRYA